MARENKGVEQEDYLYAPRNPSIDVKITSSDQRFWILPLRLAGVRFPGPNSGQ